MKLFAISYYAPPQLTPQAIQIARLLYHLDAACTLLHGRDAQMADGYDQYPDFFDRVTPLLVPDPGARPVSRWRRAALRLLPLHDQCPDRFGRWRRKALAPARACIASARPDLIASFGMPMSGHLLGLALARRTGLPWLAHFSDPWADNVFINHGTLARRINAALEQRVVAGADALLFTSDRTRQLVMRKYPPPWQAKAGVLPHAWDLRRVAPATPAAPRLLIRHLGACYGARSPLPLFEALRRILARSPRALDGVAFELVGPMAPAFQAAPVLQVLPPGLVTLRTQVSYLDALAMARASAALLVIDAPSSGDSVFLPSKLIDYIGARRPVWAISPPGTTADLVAEWAGGAHACADPADPDAIARMLLAGLARLPAADCHGPERVAHRYAPGAVAHTFRQWLRHAIDHRQGLP